MDYTIRDLIKRAGGAEVISGATQSTAKPVTSEAVHKWRRNGIPDEHWHIFIAAGLSLATIYAANEKARELKRTSLRAA